MARPENSIPDAAVARYDALIVTRPGIERKGASMPYTSINGHMFSFLMPDGTLALRLAPDELDRFLERHPTALVEQHGRVLKEYVAVPDELFARIDEVAPMFARSADHIESLRPKKTTR